MSVARAVILAAGEGKRMRPLTANRPKPMLPVAGAPIAEHLVRQLVAEGVCDITFVVGYKREAVEKHFADGTRHDARITYKLQEQWLGTADAVRTGAPLREPFVLLHGDVLLPQGSVRALLDAGEPAMLAARVPDASPFGALHVESGALRGVSEKTQQGPGVVNAGAFLLGPSALRAIDDVKPSPRGELEFTDALNALASQQRIAVREVDGWRDLAYPWHLLDANEALLKGLQRRIEGTVEPGAQLLGAIEVGAGTRIRSGAYIEGPVRIGRNCDIGPNCYVRPNTSIGDACRVGNGCEVKGTILMDGTHVGHLSYVGDSVLGERVNLGAGTITANLRHDGKNIKATWYGQRLDTGRRKFGAILGDDVHTGIHTSLNIGTVLEAGATTKPGEVVG